VLRRDLGVDLAEQFRRTNEGREHGSYRLWRGAVEDLGVLVFQATGVPLKEMRGLAIPDAPFPIILVNARDWAQSR